MKKDLIFDGIDTNYEIYDDGRIYNKKTHKFLKGTTKRNEYLSVQLTIGGKVKTLMVHRLVAENFLDNPDNLQVVHHIDGDKLNNNVSNLMWIDTKEHSKLSNSNRVTKRKSAEKVTILPETGDYWMPVANHDGYIISRKGEVINIKTKKYLCGSMRNGYVRVTLGDKPYSLHRLVYESFVGPISGIIDHIDGDKTNNSLENLRDVSQSENAKNAQKNGRMGQTKVSQYTKDGVFIKTYNSFSEAAREMGVTYVAIRSAADRNGTSCGYIWKKEL